MTSRIRVLVVDDSAIARRFITARLEKDPEIEVIGAADSGTAGLDAIRRDPPEVVVLDEEMPDMRGRDVLKVIRKEHPTVAVVMFSARVGSGAQARFEALVLGADDAVSKPVSTDGPVGDGHPTWTELLTKAKAAARRQTRGGVDVAVARALPTLPTPAATPEPAPTGADPVPRVRAQPDGGSGPGPAARPDRRDRSSAPTRERGSTPGVRRTASSTRAPAAVDREVPPPPARSRTPRPPSPPARARRSAVRGRSLCVIASSTGGPDALSTVFDGLPADFPLPILIAQHMPPHFTRLLAERLDGRSALTVREDQGGEEIVPGTAFIAPGDHHLVVDTGGGTLRTALDLGPPENSCRPAADTLFRSAVAAVGGRILACVMSGMGHDGTEGAKLIHAAGGTVFAQDEPTSVVWGMPGAVVGAGVADRVLPLDRIASELTLAAQRVAGGPHRQRKALA